MEQSVHITFKKAILSLVAFLLLHSAFAQPAPELIFRNPALEQGVAGQDGAVYRFCNVTKGIDGLLKIKKRSDAAVVLEDIDVANIGWDNALQPRLGVSGRVLADQIWWMQFELQFVQHNSTKKVTLTHFVATPIDVDGDNVAVREFLQMDKINDVAYSAHTSLKTETALPEHLYSAVNNNSDDEDHSSNLSGRDNRIVGPITSFTGMDTSATAVMATYTYENKDAITFIMGATSDGAAGMAGLRLNSLWFKNFNLAPQETPSINLETFSAIYAGKIIKLNWKTTSERGFSHFVIERSVDGRTYSDIALIRATGSERRSTYCYKDKPVLMSTGIAYYRLRVMDKHRLASYSSVSAVSAKGGKNATKVVVFSNVTEGSSGIGLLSKVKQ